MLKGTTMSNINNILKQINNLDASELKEIIEKLLQMLSNADGAASCVSVDKCRKCDSNNIVRFGKDKNGKQRYKCKSCGATFTSTSYSVMANTRHSYVTWKKYLSLLLEGASLHKCAAVCKISVQTAFTWRHKILNALQTDQDNRCLAGIVEVDEMFVSVSYKGNHSKSKRFKMPRDAYHRGSDNKSATGSKACVMYAVERNGQTYGECIGKGQPTPLKVAYSFENRIMPESIVISDGAGSIKKFYDNIPNIDLVQLKSPETAKRNKEAYFRVLDGVYHIQTVNNLHTRFRKFMGKYNGVATKYLNHYVNLFVWIENYKKINNVDINKELYEYALTKNTYICAKDFLNMPPIPVPCVA